MIWIQSYKKIGRTGYGNIISIVVLPTMMEDQV